MRRPERGQRNTRQQTLPLTGFGEIGKSLKPLEKECFLYVRYSGQGPDLCRLRPGVHFHGGGAAVLRRPWVFRAAPLQLVPRDPQGTAWRQGRREPQLQLRWWQQLRQRRWLLQRWWRWLRPRSPRDVHGNVLKLRQGRPGAVPAHQRQARLLLGLLPLNAASALLIHPAKLKSPASAGLFCLPRRWLPYELTSTRIGTARMTASTTGQCATAQSARSRRACRSVEAPLNRTLMLVLSGPAGTPSSRPRMPRSSDSLVTSTSTPPTSRLSCAARIPISVATHAASAARRYQPGDGADPPPPMDEGMSVVNFSPDWPRTLNLRPSSRVADATLSV